MWMLLWIAISLAALLATLALRAQRRRWPPLWIPVGLLAISTLSLLTREDMELWRQVLSVVILAVVAGDLISRFWLKQRSS